MQQGRRELRRRLLGVAAAQSGYFSAAQAKDTGYSYQAQKYHVDAENWVRVDRGLFRVPEWPIGDHDHLARWCLWSRGRAVVSHQTALSVHDLGDVNPAVVHLTVPQRFGQRHDERLVLHRAELPDGDIQGHDGFRITTPLRSLFDVAAAGVEQGVVNRAVADALDGGVVSRRQLLRRVDDFGPQAAVLIERALNHGTQP